jgi:hypothetical protein
MSPENLTCREIEPDLVAVAAGEAGVSAARSVDRHVAGCRDCRDELARYRVLEGMVADLRREAELLAEQLRQDARRQEQASRQQQNGQRGQGQQSAASDAKSQAATLQQASEDMRGAASQLRREDPGSARGQSDQALQKLRGVERALSESGPDERRKALGDTELEARQLATRQRQLNEQAARASEPGRSDARRQRATRRRAAEPSTT